MSATYLSEVCKVGKGAACCRYVACSSDGWQCLKVLPDMKAKIDAIAFRMGAIGDNCDGRAGNLMADA